VLQKNRGFVLLLSLCFVDYAYAGRSAELLMYKKGDFLFDFKVDHKGEIFYVKNANFLSGNPLDQYSYAQTTWDFTSHARFGDSINSKMTLRERARWGETRAILTTAETVKIADVTLDEHQHGFNRLVPFFRKIWVKFSLNDAFSISAEQRHYLKCGVFPFELGRGISLGAAYATAPGILGFFTDNSIDQYAPGILLHGDITTKYGLGYDAYTAVLQNLSTSVSKNTEVVYSNCYGCPSIYRGFGTISYILAGRLLWKAFDEKSWGKLTAEPYALLFSYPDNKVEYKSDAAVKLGTYGFAVEYQGPQFELGFETAANAGHQCVRTWDRNYITASRNTTTAALEEVYSNIFAVPVDSTFSSSSAKAQVTATNKRVVDKSSSGTNFNEAAIGTGEIVSATGVTTCTLYNGKYRFRPAYRNNFGGFMMVFDGTYWIQPKELKISAALAYASGDEHPNVILKNAEDIEYTDTYSGFIGLQEIYSGKRVRSVFILGQPVPRPLTAPYASLSSTMQQHYAHNVSGFTNLIYTGAGLTWTPNGFKRKIKINPNMLYYWQASPSKMYCLLATPETIDGQLVGGDTLEQDARRALGLEINLLAEISWLDNLQGYAVLAIFIPGPHYKDVIGKPINASQYKEVIRTSRYGIDYNSYPLLNNKAAFALNVGFEYLF